MYIFQNKGEIKTLEDKQKLKFYLHQTERKIYQMEIWIQTKNKEHQNGKYMSEDIRHFLII